MLAKKCSKMPTYKYKTHRQEYARKLCTALSQKLAGYEYRDALLDIDVLMMHCSNLSRAELIALDENEGIDLSEEAIALFCSLCEKRSTGYPVAYLTCQKEFYGYDYFVDESVLIPKSDTETLVELALDFASQCTAKNNSQSFKILDLCCGSGCIGLSVLLELRQIAPQLKISLDLLDVSGEALAVCKKNATRLVRDDEFCSLRFWERDLRKNLPSENGDAKNGGQCNRGENYDLILGNPPYVSSLETTELLADGRSEPRLALDGGERGMDLYEPIATIIKTHLGSEGRFFLEAGENINEVYELYKALGFKSLSMYKDLSRAFRVISGEV